MSLEKIKEVKQLSSTNEYVGTPIGCNAENVDMADGSNLEEKLDDIDTNIESVNNEVKEIQDSIQIDGVTITRDDATKVIALAKTLQDKIVSVDSKINATNIANNLTTTEANFVLDARQGKTLQDQITSLNNDSVLRGNLGLGDYETKSVKLKPGFYIFVNCHVFSPQITTLIVMSDASPRTDNILQAASEHEVEISETDETHTTITFSAKGCCRGHLYDMHIYY